MPTFDPRWEPTERLDRAFALARRMHASQSRKTSDGEQGTPYISHLMAVCALVIENGGTEEQAIAALLHDFIEDISLQRILDVEVGAGARAIVEKCTDTEVAKETTKAPWIERKRAYLTALEKKESDDSSLLVALADKVHNATITERELRGLTSGQRTAYFAKFNAGEAEQREWYTGLAERFLEKATTQWRPLALEFDDLVRRMFG